MHLSVCFRALTGAVVLFVAASAVEAQASSYRVAPSGRASTAVTLSRGTQEAKIVIDYGQPHLRGRDVLTLIPLDTQWRLGANVATSITTDLDLVIGGVTLPKGTYSLFTLRSGNGTKLIINRQTGMNGMQYDASQDVARVDMRSRRLSQPLESLQIALVPAQNGPSGVLRVVWGTVELETDWSVKQ